MKNFSALFSYANCNTGDIGVTDASAYIVLTYSAKDLGMPQSTATEIFIIIKLLSILCQEYFFPIKCFRCGRSEIKLFTK